MTTPTNNRGVIKFDAGGRLWSIKLPWALPALEAVLGKRLPLNYVCDLELEGQTLVLYEWGMLLHIIRPGTSTIVEIQYPLWPFSAWLDFMERHGTPRALIVGVAGTQALEWHAQYLPWASALNKLMAAFSIEIFGVKPAELIAWSPELAEDAEFQAYVGGLFLKGRLPKGQGRPKKPPPAHIQSLGLLAIEACRSSTATDMMAACRLACEHRPDWVPKRWQVGDTQPGEHLYRALRKIDGTVVDDILHLEALPHWAEQKPYYSK